MPSLVDGRNGQPLPVSILYNASEAEVGWQEIADKRGVEIPMDGLQVGRKKSRRFNLEMVSNATKQKICRLMALDYCCLNIELPSVCKVDGADGVYCAAMTETKKQMDENSPGRKKNDMQRLIIQPWENA